MTKPQPSSERRYTGITDVTEHPRRADDKRLI